MPAILSVFQVIWIYYGVLIGSRPIVMWNVIAVLINVLGVATYARFARRERGGPTEVEPPSPSR